MSWTTGPLLGLDTETTGVDVAQDRIVTVAVVLREAGNSHLRTWLLDPGVPIPTEATAIHGVTTAHAAAHGTAPAVALEEIASLVAEQQLRGVPVVAFNAAFDLALLDVELARHGMPTLAERLGRPVRPVIDPLVIDRGWDLERAGKRRLGDLCDCYGVDDVGPLHTADADVLATFEVLDAIVRTFPDLGEISLDALHDAQVGAHRRWVDGLESSGRERAYVGAGADGRWP
ncbi:exonuclease domain-containing protein [Cellulosimicrobium arenosum]|uniref:DNA polymerase III subunit epsilon n=1 Tax=Cellulosimicrobium arenosum TaxID=2708133 RepID=A0A927G7I8_9MICO|nr:exonuclease domain-containing protein [Cellulosimicrobium arenosum]MBD8078328.1 DNA polymerase III subunit epsilon [Cellulosimicrobium arenosum]